MISHALAERHFRNLDRNSHLLLFPVRLETRIKSQGAVLQVRVYLDEIWVNDHNPHLSAAELSAAKEYRQARSDDPGAQAAAWATLCARVGTARAPWVAEATEGAAPEWEWYPMSPLLPDFWVATARIKDREYQGFGAPIPRDLPMGPTQRSAPDPDHDEMSRWSWVHDYAEARAQGMALEIDLTGASPFDTIDAVTVVGVQSPGRTATAETVQSLLHSHARRHGFDLAVAGTPTKTSPEQSSGYFTPDPSRPETVRLPSGAALDLHTSDALGSASGAPVNLLLDSWRSQDDFHRRDQAQRDALTVLWPITSGAILRDDPSVDIGAETVQRWREWTLEHVRPDGPLPSLRIGDTPLGLVPVTDLDMWVPDRNWRDAERVSAWELSRIQDPQAQPSLQRHGRGGTRAGKAPKGASGLSTAPLAATGETLIAYSGGPAGQGDLEVRNGQLAVTTTLSAAARLDTDPLSPTAAQRALAIAVGADVHDNEEDARIYVVRQWRPAAEVLPVQPRTAASAAPTVSLNGVPRVLPVPRPATGPPAVRTQLDLGQFAQGAVHWRESLTLDGVLGLGETVQSACVAAGRLYLLTTGFKGQPLLRYLLLDPAPTATSAAEAASWRAIDLALPSDAFFRREAPAAVGAVTWALAPAGYRHSGDAVYLVAFRETETDLRLGIPLQQRGGAALLLRPDGSPVRGPGGRGEIILPIAVPAVPRASALSASVAAQPPVRTPESWTPAGLVTSLAALINNLTPHTQAAKITDEDSLIAALASDAWSSRYSLRPAVPLRALRPPHPPTATTRGPAVDPDSIRSGAIFIGHSSMWARLPLGGWGLHTPKDHGNLLEHFQRLLDGKNPATLFEALAAHALSETVQTERPGTQDGEVRQAFTQQIGAGGPTSEVWEALLRLRRTPNAELGQVIAGALDITSHRLDVWATAVATARLRSCGLHIQAQGGAEQMVGRAVIGGYGSVFDVKVRRAPLVSEFLHAPSAHHARTAAVLHAAAGVHPSGRPLDLSSRPMRRAVALLRGVEAGVPLAAQLGYRFEEALERLGLQVHLPAFRREFPLQVGIATDLAGVSPATASPMLRTNGLDLIKHDAAMDKAGIAAHDPARKTLGQVVDELRDDLAAINDLRTAESVHQRVGGNTERLAASNESLAKAAAALPVEPEVLRIPRSGPGIDVNVMLRMEPPPQPSADAPPRARAEPTVNAWVEQLLPPLVVVPVPGGETALDWRSRGICGLDVLTTAGTGASDRQTDLGAWLALLAAGMSPSQIPIEAAPFADFVATAALVRDVLSSARSLQHPAETAIAERLASISASVASLRLALDDPATPGDPDALREAFRAALQLGFEGFGRPLLHADATALETLKATVAKAWGPPSADGKDRELALEQMLGESIPRVGPGAPPITQKVDVDPVDGFDWLIEAGEISDPVARLLDLQLDLEQRGQDVRWHHRHDVPEEPWLGLQAARTSDDRTWIGGTAHAVFETQPDPSADEAKSAWLQLDAWTEAVPEREHITSAVFHYPTPKASAPHVALVAVNPDQGTDWTPGKVQGIISYALELSRLRVADPDLLGTLHRRGVQSHGGDPVPDWGGRRLPSMYVPAAASPKGFIPRESWREAEEG